MESLVMMIRLLTSVGVLEVLEVEPVQERQVLVDVPVEMPEEREEHQRANAVVAVVVVAVEAARMIMTVVTAEPEEDGRP
jgi:hypothetical protein